MATGNDLRKGMAIVYNGDIVVVMDTQFRAPGNKRGIVQAALRNLRTGKSMDVRFSSSENVEILPVNNIKMEYSYFDGSDYVFTDPVTFETVMVNPDLLTDSTDYLVENCEVAIMLVGEKVVQVELPASVALEVTEAPEGVKGDSVSNLQKTVVLETGKRVQAPLFIKAGEKIRVDTRTGKYMERA